MPSEEKDMTGRITSPKNLDEERAQRDRRKTKTTTDILSLDIEGLTYALDT